MIPKTFGYQVLKCFIYKQNFLLLIKKLYINQKFVKL